MQQVRTRKASHKAVELDMDINATVWIVIKNMFENKPEPLEKGSKNIQRHHPPCMIIKLQQATQHQ